MIFGTNLPLSRDGILYNCNDQVKVACNDCKGCQECCENMGDTIILDPYDVWQLTHKLKISGGGTVTFELLISEDGPLELGNHEGMVLPHIKMVATKREDVGACSFLNNGRCSIHFCRPGMCRLYPLGRIYTEDSGKTEIGYIILNDELGCKIQNTEYVKVSDWLGIEDNRYQDFIGKWHSLKKKVTAKAENGELNLTSKEYMEKQMEMLREFFVKPYGEDFFNEFDVRYENIVNLLT